MDGPGVVGTLVARTRDDEVVRANLLAFETTVGATKTSLLMDVEVSWVTLFSCEGAVVVTPVAGVNP